jgi:hypothetical protein
MRRRTPRARGCYGGTSSPPKIPEANDARLWQAEPKTTTKEQCESEVTEYGALDPDKMRLDSTGRAYRIEY